MKAEMRRMVSRLMQRGDTPGQRPAKRPAGRYERGQAMVMIAMAMIGLLAFIGLMVDAGILFIGVGHLRRAVDAAALAAAAQFREGRTLDQQRAAAREVIHLNGVEPSELVLQICDPGQSWNMDQLCPEEGQPRRKLIYIEARTVVRFAFLTIIGFHSTEIVADAVSEAASLDVVLVLDTSSSMSFDAPTTFDPVTGEPACNNLDAGGADGFPGECHPFEEVKQAAFSFVQGMYFPYDRVSIVTFDNSAVSVLSLVDPDAIDQAAVQLAISTLPMSPQRNALAECQYPPDPSGCTNTSIGGGLRTAGNEFGLALRQEAVWAVILLTDGAANASQLGPNADGDIVPNAFCPPSTWIEPFCRDADSNTRHTVFNPTPFNPDSIYDPDYVNYDADDFARDMADFVGCAAESNDAEEWCNDSLDYASGEGGQGALIYAIGLGKQVIQQGNDVDGYTFSGGDALLRYIANVGIDGNPNPVSPGDPEDPCESVDPPVIPLGPGNDSYECGNYFFSETGAGLASVFESIASRVFTRLTQ